MLPLSCSLLKFPYSVRNCCKLRDVKSRMKNAIEVAHSAKTPEEKASAWDIVEELSATRADIERQIPGSLDAFCFDYPDAPECRIYDV